MRAGDWLLIVILALTGLVILADTLTGGGVQAWAASDLSATGRQFGIALGWAGWALSPAAALPLLAALWAIFATPPAAIIQGLRLIIRIVDAVNSTIGDAVRWFALALVLVTSLIVIQRYVFGISITKLQESVIYFHALLFLLSGAATLLAGGHVRVDILYAKLKPASKAWTDILGVYLALIPMCWLILDTSRSYVGGAWRILERSREGDGLPLVFVLKTAIPVFAVMMIAQGVAMAARGILVLADRKAPQPALRDDPSRSAL